MAYEIQLAIRRKLAGETLHSPRYAFGLVVSHIPVNYYVHNEASLVEECERRPEVFPRRAVQPEGTSCEWEGHG